MTHIIKFRKALLRASLVSSLSLIFFFLLCLHLSLFVSNIEEGKQQEMHTHGQVIPKHYSRIKVEEKHSDRFLYENL